MLSISNLLKITEPTMRRIALPLALLLTLVLVAPAQAAPEFCFKQVPDCITGRFATYWRDGGLAVFDLPLTPADKRPVEGQDHKVQYFERARFEYHPELARPYDVLLGRLGVDLLAALGRDWQTFPRGDPSAAHYFAETGHAIAPQFWAFWSSHGLELDGNKQSKTIVEAIALFGYPISEAQMEQNADGGVFLTQWFERARFEYHPENKPPYDVLLGRLGAEALVQLPTPPLAPTPAAGLPGIPKPQGNCVANVPAPAEGPQAWMTAPQPSTVGQFDSVCARLILGGKIVKNAEVRAMINFFEHAQSYGPVRTGADGVAEIGFNIGDERQSRRHQTVLVNVTITAPDGQNYRTQTSFWPDYPKTP
jgi:hypothetical protein